MHATLPYLNGVSLVGPDLPVSRLRAPPHGEPLLVVVLHHGLDVPERVAPELVDLEHVVYVHVALLGRLQAELVQVVPEQPAQALAQLHVVAAAGRHLRRYKHAL